MPGKRQIWCAMLLLAASVVAACESHPESDATDAARPDAASEAGAPDAEVPDATPPTDAGDGGWFFGTDCPAAVPSSVPPGSPRILILGPAEMMPPLLAAYLQGMLAADAAFTAPEVVGQATPAVGNGPPGSNPIMGESLMNYFYQPDGREERLAWSAEPWSYVVLLEDASFALGYPEFYFEGYARSGAARGPPERGRSCS